MHKIADSHYFQTTTHLAHKLHRRSNSPSKWEKIPRRIELKRKQSIRWPIVGGRKYFPPSIWPPDPHLIHSGLPDCPVFPGCPCIVALIHSRRHPPRVVEVAVDPFRSTHFVFFNCGLCEICCGTSAMANAVASMAGLSQGVRLESTLAGTKVVSSACKGAAMVKCAPVHVRASSEETQSRRSFFSLAAASLAATALVQNARALEAIKLEPPPPPSGGLRKSQRCHHPTTLSKILISRAQEPSFSFELRCIMFG